MPPTDPNFFMNVLVQVDGRVTVTTRSGAKWSAALSTAVLDALVNSLRDAIAAAARAAAKPWDGGAA